jgi:hypothetical protein
MGPDFVTAIIPATLEQRSGESKLKTSIVRNVKTPSQQKGWTWWYTAVILTTAITAMHGRHR